MKKLASMATAGMLALSLALGTAAAPVEAKAVVSFEKHEVGVKLTRNAQGEYDDSLAYEDNKDVDVGKWSATVVAGGGHSGKALELSSMKGTKEHFMFIKLDQDENVTDWTGGTALYFYIDATGWAKAEVGIRVVANDVQWVFRHQRSDGASQANIAYVQEEDGSFVQVPEAKWGRAVLPENYTGWVKVPLSETTLMPQWWGGHENEALSLNAMSAVGIHVQSTQEVDKDKTLIVDSFCVDGLADGDIIIGEPDVTTTEPGTPTTTAPTSDNTTKPTISAKTTNQGSTTGEAAIPAMLLVALPVSAGVLLACKKRGK